MAKPYSQLLPDTKKLQQAMEQGITVALFRMGQEVRNEAIASAPYKSGDLRGSITVSPQMLGAIKDSVSIGSNKKYARIQDLGGEVRPSGRSYLTIPLPGVKGNIRNYKGFFIKSKAGRLLYVQKKGKKGIKPLYVLKKNVTIKKKPYLSKAIRNMTNGRDKAIIDEEIRHSIKQAMR